MPALGAVFMCQVGMYWGQFMRLGRPGYTKVMKNCMAVCKFLVKGIEDLNHFQACTLLGSMSLGG